jgi:hypothetical protein
MTDPVPNLPLLRKAVEWVEEQAAKPERHRGWYQPAWRETASELDRDCGTCYCLAGHVVESSGATWLDDETVAPEPGDFPEKYEFVGHRARLLLGLTRDEGHSLFRGVNSAADIRRIAERIAARAGDRL